MNAGDGIIGGMFMSGMYAAAFFEKRSAQGGRGRAGRDPAAEPVRAASSPTCWPGRSSIPTTGTRSGNASNEKWDKREPCPEGALRPFNIDAKLNGAYVALGLLYGKGDFGQDHRGRHARRAGFRLQSRQRRRHPGRDARLQAGFRSSGRAASRPSPTRNSTTRISPFTRSSTARSGAPGAGPVDRRADGRRHAFGESRSSPSRRPWPCGTITARRSSASRRATPRWQWKGEWGKKQEPPQPRQLRRQGAEAVDRRSKARARSSPARICRRAAQRRSTSTGSSRGRWMSARTRIRLAGASRCGTCSVFTDRKHTLRLVVDGKPGPGSDQTDVVVDGLIIFK